MRGTEAYDNIAAKYFAAENLARAKRLEDQKLGLLGRLFRALGKFFRRKH